MATTTTTTSSSSSSESPIQQRPELSLNELQQYADKVLQKQKVFKREFAEPLNRLKDLKAESQMCQNELERRLQELVKDRDHQHSTIKLNTAEMQTYSQYVTDLKKSMLKYESEISRLNNLTSGAHTRLNDLDTAILHLKELMQNITMDLVYQDELAEIHLVMSDVGGAKPKPESPPPEKRQRSVVDFKKLADGVPMSPEPPVKQVHPNYRQLIKALGPSLSEEDVYLNGLIYKMVSGMSHPRSCRSLKHRLMDKAMYWDRIEPHVVSALSTIQARMSWEQNVGRYRAPCKFYHTHSGESCWCDGKLEEDMSMKQQIYGINAICEFIEANIREKVLPGLQNFPNI